MKSLLRSGSLSTNITLVHEHICEMFRLNMIPHVRLGLVLEFIAETAVVAPHGVSHYVLDKVFRSRYACKYFMVSTELHKKRLSKYRRLFNLIRKYKSFHHYTVDTRTFHEFLVVEILMSLHAILALVLFETKPADEWLVGGAMFVQIMPLEVAEMLDHLSTQKALVSISHFSNW